MLAKSHLVTQVVCQQAVRAAALNLASGIPFPYPCEETGRVARGTIPQSALPAWRHLKCPFGWWCLDETPLIGNGRQRAFRVPLSGEDEVQDDDHHNDQHDDARDAESRHWVVRPGRRR